MLLLRRCRVKGQSHSSTRHTRIIIKESTTRLACAFRCWWRWESPVCFLYVLDLNVTAEQQYDALLMSNVVPMYPEFKSESGV